jgi:hypothetical protein
MEKRSLKRRHLIFYLRVIDRENECLLGFLVDITTEGVMIMSEHPLPAGKKFALKIRLHSDTVEEKFLEFAAVSKWCRASVNSEFFDTGFELADITPVEFKQIHDLIKQIGFND